MTEIRALIVDDEPLARRGVRQLLAAHPDVSVVGEARNATTALRAVETLRPALLFLDVQMPGTDGFGVLRQIEPAVLPIVVFVTAYDDFAVRAFEAHALDYLVKPLVADRFDAAMRRVREHMRMNAALTLTQRMASLLTGLEASGWPALSGSPPLPMRPASRLTVPTSTGELVLDTSEIDWIEADDYYAAVHARGKRHLVRESLASLELRLDPARFTRVHRSAIIQLDRVREVRSGNGEMMIVLRDGTRIPVSRRRRERVSAAIRALR